MIAHVVERVRESRAADCVLVATDDERIAAVVREIGAEVAMTSPLHRSGTERVAEVAAGLEAEIVISIQGDEPMLDPQTIRAALDPLLRDPSIPISTTSEPIEDIEDVLNPNVVKVVTDAEGYALYFSRQPIPWPREAIAEAGDLRAALEIQSQLLRLYRKHTGLYVFRRSTLLQLSRMKPSPLERAESLEQLRALENGIPILVVPVETRAIGVDTLDDLERVRAAFAQRRNHV